MQKEKRAKTRGLNYEQRQRVGVMLSVCRRVVPLARRCVTLCGWVELLTIFSLLQLEELEGNLFGKVSTGLGEFGKEEQQFGGNLPYALPEVRALCPALLTILPPSTLHMGDKCVFRRMPDRRQMERPRSSSGRTRGPQRGLYQRRRRPRQAQTETMPLPRGQQAEPTAKQSPLTTVQCEPALVLLSISQSCRQNPAKVTEASGLPWSIRRPPAVS